jgi:Peptidase A4 family
MRRRFLLLLTSAAMLAAVPGATPGVAAAASVVRWHRPIVAVGASQSNNWSGYNQGTLEQGGKMFNAITGTWTVPTATQHTAGEAEYSSSWIGIGGGCVDAGCTVTDSTLIQAGTEQDVAADGTASYSAWYELIPAPSIAIDTMTIHAGDHMRVSISEGPPGSNVWTFDVRDKTTHESFTLTVPYSSTHATAEWIEETPVVIDDSGNVTIGPLPKLSKVHFNRGTTNGAGAGLVASEAIQLVDTDGTALATPSDPDPTADGFRDCTYKAHCKAPTTG